MRQLVFKLVLLYTLLSATSFGTSFVAWPLEEIPKAEDVFAFTTSPPSEPGSAFKTNQLSREDLLVFLREGVRREPEFSPPKRDPYQGFCDGVFFSQQGVPYYWQLEDKHTLYLSSTGHRCCHLTLASRAIRPKPQADLPANAPLLRLPKPDQVRFVVDNPHSMSAFRISRNKDDVVRWLTDGKAFQVESQGQEASLRFESLLTVPKEMANRLLPYLDAESVNKVHPAYADLKVSGILATQGGAIYFWEQLGDGIIEFSEASGAKCILRTPLP